MDPGVYPISVKAHNSVSQMAASMNVTVQYPILSATVTIHPTVLEQTSYINITLRGGREFNVFVAFGDGNTQNRSSTEMTSSELWPLKRKYRSMVPEYGIRIAHLYKEIQSYQVTVNISNLVSYIVKSETAVVEEPISGIVLTTESRKVVSVLDEVIVMVTVAMGKDLTFDWDFSDKFNPDPDVKR